MYTRYHLLRIGHTKAQGGRGLAPGRVCRHLRVRRQRAAPVSIPAAEPRGRGGIPAPVQPDRVTVRRRQPQLRRRAGVRGARHVHPGCAARRQCAGYYLRIQRRVRHHLAAYLHTERPVTLYPLQNTPQKHLVRHRQRARRRSECRLQCHRRGRGVRGRVCLIHPGHQQHQGRHQCHHNVIIQSHSPAPHPSR